MDEILNASIGQNTRTFAGLREPHEPIFATRLYSSADARSSSSRDTLSGTETYHVLVGDLRMLFSSEVCKTVHLGNGRG